MMKKITRLISGLIALSLFLFPVSALSANKLATLIDSSRQHKVIVEVGSNLAQEYFGYGYSLFVPNSLGFNVITDYEANLSSSMTSSQTTVPVGSMLTTDGHTITMADLGAAVYLTVEPGAKKKEIIKCTGISGNSFTGCTRGLPFYGTTETSVTANQYAHSAGSKVIMSNVHYVYKQLVDKDSNETIGGIKTFSSFPLLPNAVPTSSLQAINKQYVDDSVVAGGVIGSETLPGVWEGATQAEMTNGTATSTYGLYDYNLILQNKYANATSSATTIVPVTKSNGKLSQGFLDLSEDFTFTGTTTLATTTISNISFSGLPSTTATTTVPTSGQFVAMNNENKLPAVDGSNLTNISDYNFGEEYHIFQLNYGTPGVVADVSNYTYRVTNYVGVYQLYDSSAQPYIGFHLSGNAGTAGRMAFDEGKTVKIRASIKLESTSGANFAFGLAESQLKDSGGTGVNAQIRFVFDGSNLYAQVGKGDSSGNITQETITGITLTNYNDYVIEWDGADEANFYINGVLKKTITTNSPKTATDDIWVQAGITASRYLYMTPITVVKAK